MACYVCYEPDAIRCGCACRGDGAYAHVECIARIAELGPVDGSRWRTCATCKTEYTGPLRARLAEIRYERAATLDESDDLRVDATSCYAWSLVVDERYEEAERITRRQLEVVDCVRARHNLAACAFGQGRVAEARDMYERLYDEHAREGEDELGALCAKENLARCRMRLGETARAVCMYREVFEAHGRIHGAVHPRTIDAQARLAVALAFQESGCEEAERMLRDAHAKQALVLGREHASTLRTETSLGMLILKRGRVDEATSRLRAVLEAEVRAFGAHGSAEPLAMCLARKGLAVTRLDRDTVLPLACLVESDYDAAAAAYARVLEARERVSGAEHPRTLRVKCQLALALDARGDHDAAWALHRATHETCVRVLGRRHELTRRCARDARCLARWRLRPNRHSSS
jgi:tetratricopeptide (TPR) repeat protein